MLIQALEKLGIPPSIKPEDLARMLVALGVTALLQALDSLILAQTIADCNGHFRLLEALSVKWNEPGSRQLSYPFLIHNFGVSLEAKYRNLDLPLLILALRGIAVKPADIVPGTTQTFGKFLQEGYFLNTPGDLTANKGDLDTSLDATQSATDQIATNPASHDTTTEFVPRVSPLQLLLFAKARANSEDKSQPVRNPFTFYIIIIVCCYILTVSSGIPIFMLYKGHVRTSAEFYLATVREVPCLLGNSYKVPPYLSMLKIN